MKKCRWKISLIGFVVLLGIGTIMVIKNPFLKEKLLTHGIFAWFLSEETPIDGVWYQSGTLTDGGGNFSWYVEYHFDKGLYTKEGYPPFYEEGTYDVETLEALHYKVALYPQEEGASTWTLDVWVSEDGQTIEIANGETYSFTPADAGRR